MTRSTTMWLTLGTATLAVTCLVAARPEKPAAPRTSARPAVALDMSAPLASMEQFIPDKAIVIHPAVVSPPERQGSIKGPGESLGSTGPTPPAARGGAGRGAGGA